MQQGEWPRGLKVGLDRYLPCRHLQAAAQGDLQALQAAWQQAGHSWHAHAWGVFAPMCPQEDQFWTRRLSAVAAAGGHLALLQWLHHNGCWWNQRTCSGAARGGHLAVLQWARQNGCDWDEDTCASAAGGGHLAVLEWARQNGCRWDEGTCSGAARGGHLAVLQWARQNGCNWEEDTCYEAAEGGHLEVLQWAYKNNCPWSGSTTFAAAQKNHLDILKWAWQQQPSCPWWSPDELDEYCFDNTTPSTLLWLAQQGAPLPDGAHAIACSTADRLTHACIALRALLPADILNHILTLAVE